MLTSILNSMSSQQLCSDGLLRHTKGLQRAVLVQTVQLCLNPHPASVSLQAQLQLAMGSPLLAPFQGCHLLE